MRGCGGIVLVVIVMFALFVMLVIAGLTTGGT